MRMQRIASISLVDAGDGRRLERFGDLLLDRPAPAATAPRRAAAPWFAADLRFEPRRGWSGRAPLAPWAVEVEGLILELRPVPSGGVGLFPEQLANLEWLEARIAERRTADRFGPDRRPEVLNLFAHTGLLSLVAARAGAAVVHVDASRPAVAWARRNAELSALTEAPIRWLVDDAGEFVAREGRRGRRYDGLVLDPPSFGRAGGRRWRLLDDLPALLDACAAVASDDAFVLLTAHTTGLDGEDLVDLVAAALGSATPAIAPLRLAAASGASLDLGWAVRIDRLGDRTER